MNSSRPYAQFGCGRRVASNHYVGDYKWIGQSERVENVSTAIAAPSDARKQDMQHKAVAHIRNNGRAAGANQGRTAELH